MEFVFFLKHGTKIGEIEDTSKSNVGTMNVVLKVVLLLVHQNLIKDAKYY